MVARPVRYGRRNNVKLIYRTVPVLYCTVPELEYCTGYSKLDAIAAVWHVDQCERAPPGHARLRRRLRLSALSPN